MDLSDQSFSQSDNKYFKTACCILETTIGARSKRPTTRGLALKERAMGCWQCRGCEWDLEHIEGGAKDAPRFLDCGEHGRGDLEDRRWFQTKTFWSLECL